MGGDVHSSWAWPRQAFLLLAAAVPGPDILTAIMGAAALHFADGALTRAQHEMIASYVSALNRCHY